MSSRQEFTLRILLHLALVNDNGMKKGQGLDTLRDRAYSQKLIPVTKWMQQL